MARTYELTDKGRGMEFKNQKGLIHKALLDGPRNVEQIATSIKPKLETRQEPAKVVAFYMSIWKKQGVVKVVNEATETTVQGTNVETQPAEKQEIAALDTPVSDGTDSSAVDSLAVATDEHAEERAEAVAPTNDRDPALQQRDGETLQGYIFRLVNEHGARWPTDIEEMTFGAIKKKQAQDTLRRLQGGQHVAKSEDGYRAVANNPYVG